MIVQDISKLLVSPPPSSCKPLGAIDEELIDIDRRKNCESPNEKKCATEKIQEKERDINTSGDASMSIERTSFLCMIASDSRRWTT